MLSVEANLACRDLRNQSERARQGFAEALWIQLWIQHGALKHIGHCTRFCHVILYGLQYCLHFCRSFYFD